MPYEVAFILKILFDKYDIYEIGLISNILIYIRKNDIINSIYRKHLMITYMEYINKIKHEKDNCNKKIKINNIRIKEINNKLIDPKILISDGPSKNTRSKKKSLNIMDNEYRKLLEEKNKLISDIDSINYKFRKYYFLKYKL